MKVTLAVLADYANVSREGKLNILGIFNIIHAASFPCTHGEMVLVTKLEAEVLDSKKPRKIEVNLVIEEEQIKVDLPAEASPISQLS